MDTVVLGTNSFGLPIHFDRNAFEADGIVLLNRIKPHTSFTGRYESGLLKMLTIGLGKRQGAAQVHKLGLPGLEALLPEVGAFLLGRRRSRSGSRCWRTPASTRRGSSRSSPRSCSRSSRGCSTRPATLMARLPFDQIDVLVVGELGKNYSGTGLDPNVIGRQRVETMPDLPRPVVTRLAVLDLSVETRGNALGIGLADLTTERLVASDRPDADAGEQPDQQLPDPRPRSADACPTDRDVFAALPRHLLADRPDRGPDGR